MTDYNKLAQRIVKQGIGKFGYFVPNGTGIEAPLTAEAFCNDGRVVLALLEKCWERGLFIATIVNAALHKEPEAGGLGPAFCEACCDALEGE